VFLAENERGRSFAALFLELDQRSRVCSFIGRRQLQARQLFLGDRHGTGDFKLPDFLNEIRDVPEVRRDVAMIVPESTTHETVLNAVKKLKPANLERVDLFDVFHGQNIPPGQKSMAYAFTYRHPERTLTDAEVGAAHQQVLEQFRKELNATIRD